jgi:hypothetical protein
MTEPADSDIDWDETVDVLCVGTGAGVLGYGVFCAAADLDVLVIESDELDPQTAEWRSAMVEDLAGVAPTADLSLIRAESVTRERINDRTRLETFVGEELRQWSAGCLASAYGVMFTEVPDLEPMRTSDGQSIVAGAVGSYRFADRPPGVLLAGWLREQADGLLGPAADRLDGLVTENGRIAGVILSTDDGPRLIAAAKGLAIPVGAVPDRWPEQPELDGLTCEVAVVGRIAGRFARLELLGRSGPAAGGGQ